MSSDQGIVILYVPCGSEDEAARLASVLISERLAACANIYASRSLYRWEGKLADETEYVMWAKTISDRVGAATRKIEELHTYDTPCILRFSPDSVNRAYESWIRGEVSAAYSLEPTVRAEPV